MSPLGLKGVDTEQLIVAIYPQPSSEYKPKPTAVETAHMCVPIIVHNWPAQCENTAQNSSENSLLSPDSHHFKVKVK